jgi:hypothetical protein
MIYWQPFILIGGISAIEHYSWPFLPAKVVFRNQWCMPPRRPILTRRHVETSKVGVLA